MTLNDMNRLVFLFLIVALTSCDFDVNVNSRSGSMEDDYVEEPLIGSVKKYDKALSTSNLFIDEIKLNNLSLTYESFFSESLRSTISLNQFENFIHQLVSERGKILAYKPMQWNFIKLEQDGKNYIASVKIVEHENVLMKYLVAFDANGPFDEIVYLNFKRKTGVLPAGQF